MTPFDMLEDALDAPEAAAGKDGGLGGCLRRGLVQRRGAGSRARFSASDGDDRSANAADTSSATRRKAERKYRQVRAAEFENSGHRVSSAFSRR